MVVARGDEGKGTVWAMLLCIAVISFYLKGGKAIVEQFVDPKFSIILIITFGVIAIFTIGCALHMVFVGDRSSRELRRELSEQSETIDSFINASKNRIEGYETQALHYSGIIRPQALEKVGYVRRIINALQRRNNIIKQLLDSKNSASLFDAYELSCKKLEIVENALDSLIGGSPVPPIEAGEWFLVVEQAFAEIEADLSWAYQQKNSYAAA